MVSLSSNKDRLRVGAVQPEEGQALGSPYYSLSVTKGGLHESRRALQWPVVIGQGRMAFNWKRMGSD